jgi:hypothetical protein
MIFFFMGLCFIYMEGGARLTLFRDRTLTLFRDRHPLGTPFPFRECPRRAAADCVGGTFQKKTFRRWRKQKKEPGPAFPGFHQARLPQLGHELNYAIDLCPLCRPWRKKERVFGDGVRIVNPDEMLPAP